MQIRAADPDDIPAIVALVESSYRGDGSRLGWTTEADLLDGQRTDDDAVSDCIAADSSSVILAVDNGRLLGCCHVKRTAEHEAYFGMLAVEPRLQGRGTGRALVEASEEMAREQWGASRMLIQVIRQRTLLIGWYERMGYAATGDTVPFPYNDEHFGIPKRLDLEFVVLAKTLDGPTRSS